MAYYVVDFDDIESPVEENLFELESGEYILSEDEVPDAEKTYYAFEEEFEEEEEDEYEELAAEVGDPLYGDFYEFDGTGYVRTDDTTVQAGKSYFVYTGYVYEEPYDIDDRYYVEIGPVDDPSVEGLLEKSSDGEYFVTEDTEFDPDKLYFREAGEKDLPSVNEETEEPYYLLPDVDFDGELEVEEATVPSDLEMVYADTEFVEDPQAEGFYEIVEGEYVLTSDTELVEGKTYYESYSYSDYYVADMEGVDNPSFSLNQYYELVNEEYVLTQDTPVDAQKTYYRSHEDDENFYVPDPTVEEE